jgi:hypothetical protein
VVEIGNDSEGFLLVNTLFTSDDEGVNREELFVQARPAFSPLDLDPSLGEPDLGEVANHSGVAVAVHLVLISHMEGVAEAEELEAVIAADGDGFHIMRGRR